MKIGYIGLGKMGAAMVELLIEKGHEVIAYDPNEDARADVGQAGAKTVSTIADLISNFAEKKFIWIMVPHTVVDKVLSELTIYLNKGDVVIDGGNSNYKDSMRRGKELSEKHIIYMDVGVSGGPSGARHGACMMIGGDKYTYEKYESLFKDICVEDGYGYMGEIGAGHYVKMIHNGIEYGMMQAIGEGFEILKSTPFNFNLTDISRVYNHGSVIESRLIEWLHNAYTKEGQDLENISGEIAHSGEGEWTVQEAKSCCAFSEEKKSIPVPAIESALNFRINSKGNPSYTGKVISALRNQFGGHKVKKNGD